MLLKALLMLTAWKVSKQGVFSGTHFPVFGLRKQENTDQKKTQYLNTFHAVVIKKLSWVVFILRNNYRVIYCKNIYHYILRIAYP